MAAVNTKELSNSVAGSQLPLLLRQLMIPPKP